jgi:hypothetical protein
MSVSRLFPAVAACVLLLAGCSDPKVTSYRVPHEPDPAPVAPSAVASAPGTAAGMAGTPVATAAGAGLTWTAPAHWQSRPATAMRKGTYALTGEGGEAELAITAFPGDVGGDLANVNRWRGQIGLGNITAAELSTSTLHVDANDLHMTVADYTGQGAFASQRMIGAIVPAGGETWFFKLSGPAAIVTRERDAFMAFLNTIRPATP